ncbi:DUF2599 domain-containing protein [Mycobacterium botniense]|uniref:Uncharacterized protein n=1 Tax=Mycobacterium botniense TaxID=84962 RepID=A0A7I9XV81_9MYCO|nr:DUF2599 domain-containing protein [Mycobacterium botniense]GFG73407.1 hypothetical protein MBOT_07720 [Mycobacterium botniense]
MIVGLSAGCAVHAPGTGAAVPRELFSCPGQAAELVRPRTTCRNLEPGRPAVDSVQMTGSHPGGAHDPF